MTGTYTDLPQPGEESDREVERGFALQDLISAVRRRWWAVLAVFLVVVSWSMWRTLRQERQYLAATTVRIRETQLPAAAMSPRGSSVDWRVDRLLSEQLIIKSQNVAVGVVKSLGLQVQVDPEAKLRRSQVLNGNPPRLLGTPTSASYTLRLGADSYEVIADGQRHGPARYGDSLDAGGLILHLARRPAIGRDEVRLYLADTLGVANAIRSAIVTRVVPQTDIVQITYQGNDPPLVRDITNAIAENYKNYSATTQKENATTKANFILARLEDQQVQLRRAQDSLKAFQTRHQTADVSAEQLALATSIVELEKQKQDVLGERSVYEKLIGNLQAADTTDEALRRIVGTGAGEKNQTIARLFDRWYEYQEKRQQMMTAGGRNEKNPDVQANAELIAQVKLELQDASRLYLRALQSRLQSIEGQIEAARVQAQAYPPLTAEQARLLANVRTSEQIYTELQSEYQRARIAEAADVGSVTIVDPAVLPTFAISPNRRRAATTAIIFGLLLGLGAAVLLDRLDTSIRSPDEIRERYDLTVLGMIPAIQAHDVNAGPQPVAEKNRLVTHADPRSPVAESYRSLRTNLAFARAHQDLRTMVLTSPGPADGKSTTIANLAITFAQQGQRTLVVDADLRRAVLDKTFDVPRSPGLTDAIIGKVKLADAVHETDIPNLFVLGSGEFPPNPSELLGSEGMRRLIAEARESFDAVLFDTPPLLAVTDAAVLSTRVDGTVLVVRMGKTAREAVRRALLTLRAVHPRILGAVLNDVDFRSGSYYGGYGYYYYAYHYHADTPSNGNGRRGSGMIDRLRGLAGVGGRKG